MPWKWKKRESWQSTVLLGVNKESIKKAEDREAFKQLMQEINEPTPSSVIATTSKECYDFIEKEGYPVIIRPAYTLGGTGGGIADNQQELEELCYKGMESSAIGQILLEKSVAGWKEIEFEVMRDRRNNCIIICSMENMDPVGVHTGDSIAIEVNPRVSRSSALTSKIDASLMNYDMAQKWLAKRDGDNEESLSLVINAPAVVNRKENDSFPVRRKAIERGISVMTCMDTARVFLKAIRLKQQGVHLSYNSLD